MRKQIDGRSSARIARSEARLQSTAGDLRIFPGFSRSGKCDSRERSESERQRSVIPICESTSKEGPQPGLPEAKRGCNLRRETCNVRYRSLLRLRLRCPFCQSARRWLSGQKGVFPRERSNLQGKCDSRGGKPPRTKVLWLSHGIFREIRDFGTSLQPKRVGATKERCGFSPALAGAENATAGSEASRSDEGALSRFAL